jgi:hypothetical protein
MDENTENDFELIIIKEKLCRTLKAFFVDKKTLRNITLFEIYLNKLKYKYKDDSTNLQFLNDFVSNIPMCFSHHNLLYESADYFIRILPIGKLKNKNIIEDLLMFIDPNFDLKERIECLEKENRDIKKLLEIQIMCETNSPI